MFPADTSLSPVLAVSISDEFVERLQTEFAADPKNQLAQNICTKYDLNEAARSRTAEAINHVFQHKVSEITPVRSPRSGHPGQVTPVRSPRSGHPGQVIPVRSSRSGHPSQVTPVRSPQSGHPGQGVRSSRSGHPGQVTPVRSPWSGHPSQVTPVRSPKSGHPGQGVRSSRSGHPGHFTPVRSPQSGHPSHVILVRSSRSGHPGQVTRPGWNFLLWHLNKSLILGHCFMQLSCRTVATIRPLPLTAVSYNWHLFMADPHSVRHASYGCPRFCALSPLPDI